MSPCPICASSASRLLYRLPDDSPGRGDAHPLEIHRCEGCRLTFAVSGLREVDIKELYETYWKATWGRACERFMPKAERYAAAQAAYVETLTSRGRLLDVGCGTGLFLEAASARGWEVAGVELSMTAAAEARRRVGERVAVGTLEEAKFSDDTFDVVTLWEVIEHVPQPVKLLSEVRRVLRPGGVLLLSTPNGRSLFHRIAHWSYILTLGRWNFPARRIYSSGHLYYFTKQTLLAALLKAGFCNMSSPPLPAGGWGIFDDLEILFEANRRQAWMRIPLLKTAVGLGLELSRLVGVPYRLICAARKDHRSPGV